MFTIKQKSKMMIFFKWLVIALLLSGTWTGRGVPAAYAACASSIIYVKTADEGGKDTNDGCSWDSAYATLQQALDNATAGHTIWIAKGTYNPTKEVGGSGDRYRTFQMKNGVGIYGGFTGNEPETFSLEGRNFTANKTILSGDFGTGDENKAYHVFYHNNLGLDESAVLDGVTITGGNAGSQIRDRYGGGMYNIGSSPTLMNVTISGNTAEMDGGGMYNETSSPMLMNVKINDNEADRYGGGMYNKTSSPTLTNVTINDNMANFNSGGGMYNYNNSNPTLTNVTISDNTASSGDGGGMSNTSNSSPMLTDVTISGNMAKSRGGGMYNGNSSNPTLTNITISGNMANRGGGVYNNDNSSPTLTNMTISGNTANRGGGVYNVISSPMLTDVTINDNTATEGGGGVYNVISSPMLTNMTISGNTARSGGGGMYNYNNSTPTLTNMTISGNTATYGGSMSNGVGSSPTLTNVTISDNKAAINMGGSMYNYNNSTPKIRNSIIWNNTPGITNNDDSEVTISNSIIQDESGMDGPLFHYSPGPSAAPTTAGDYRLQAASPAIGTGDVGLYNAGEDPDLSAITTDMDMKSRIVNGKIDMGAYQYQAGVDISAIKHDIIKGFPVQYEISLLTEPGKDVVVTPTSSANLQLSPATLTFTPADWNTPQTVTVTVPDEADTGGAITETIMHSVQSDFALYNGLPVDSVEVTIYKEAGPTWSPDSRLSVSDITQTSVKLSWPAATGFYDIVGYRVYKDDLIIANLTSGILEYQVNRLDTDSLHTFTVKAYDRANKVSDPGLQASPYIKMTRIEPFEKFQVAKGTMLEQSALPPKVRIQVENGSEMDVPVDWDLVNTDFKPNQVGSYQVTGSIQLPEHIRNLGSLRAELTVEVLPGTDAELSTIYVDGITIEDFKPGIFSYHFNVPFVTEQVTVTAETSDSSAAYQVIGGELQQLQVGNNRVEIEVTAENGDVQTYTLNLEREQTVPIEPMHLTAAAGDQSVTLNWDAVTEAGTVTYAVYQVAGTIDSFNPNELVLVQEDITSTTYKVTGLANGTNYVFAVTASNAKGTSSFSNVASAAPKTAGGNSNPGGGSVGPITPAPPVMSTDGKLILPVGREGEVKLGEEVTISIPSGAADQELTITIEKLQDIQYLEQEDIGFVSPVYELLKNISGNFKKPVTLTIKFDPTKVNEGQIPAIYYYDEGEQEWIEIGGKIEGDRITVDVDHFTKFAVLVVDKKPEITFSDITGHWAEEFILQAARLGIIKGHVDGTFKPDKDLTRAQAVSILVRALDLQTDEVAPFTDIKGYAAETQAEIAAAYQYSLVIGQDGNFMPSKKVTRSQMALMLHRAYEQKTGIKYIASEKAAYPDIGNADEETINAISMLQELGIATGSNGKFMPANPTTRAHAAKMLVNFFSQD